MSGPVEIPDLLRRAMEKAGIDPDKVAAQAAEVADTLHRPETPPAPAPPPRGEPVADGQQSLLGVIAPTTGEQLRDEGMARADQAADPDWKDAAWRAIVVLANSGDEFTADDVWERVGFAPSEPRALGPLLVKAAKTGMIRNTGRRRNSRRPEHHAFPCAIWEPAT